MKANPRKQPINTLEAYSKISAKPGAQHRGVSAPPVQIPHLSVEETLRTAAARASAPAEADGRGKRNTKTKRDKNRFSMAFKMEDLKRQDSRMSVGFPILPRILQFNSCFEELLKQKQ